jgi:hypothetical protein
VGKGGEQSRPTRAPVVAPKMRPCCILDGRAPALEAGRRGRRGREAGEQRAGCRQR